MFIYFGVVSRFRNSALYRPIFINVVMTTLCRTVKYILIGYFLYMRPIALGLTFYIGRCLDSNHLKELGKFCSLVNLGTLLTWARKKGKF